jgi:poly(3-hydroxybutyrate) depolymerase
MVSTLDPVVAGRNAYLAMGSRADRVPLLVSYGTLDPNAALADQDALIQQWQVTHDLVDDRELNGSVPRTVAATRTGYDGRNYTVDTYVDAQGCVLIERWLIDGMRHAYSGGTPTSPLDTDVDTGPDMRAVAYDFFLAQTAPTGPPAPDGGRCP